MHKVLQTLEEKRPKWISMQLQKARKLCSDRSEVKLFGLARGWNATKFINVFTPSKKRNVNPPTVAASVDYSCAPTAKDLALFYSYHFEKKFPTLEN